jgi:hypothetical protein
MPAIRRAVPMLAVLAVALSAAAQEKPAAPAGAEEKAATAGSDAMAGWKPPVVKGEKRDRQEITAFFDRMEKAGTKGDLAAGAALVDFPVLMVTDDSKGEAKAQTWSREQWENVMRPFYAKPMPAGAMRHKPTITLVTDSLAVVTDAWTMDMGGKKVSGRSGSILVRKGGEWKAKAMVEGGWGDAPAGAAAEPGGAETPPGR